MMYTSKACFKYRISMRNCVMRRFRIQLLQSHLSTTRNTCHDSTSFLRNRQVTNSQRENRCCLLSQAFKLSKLDIQTTVIGQSVQYQQEEAATILLYQELNRNVEQLMHCHDANFWGSLLYNVIKSRVNELLTNLMITPSDMIHSQKEHSIQSNQRHLQIICTLLITKLNLN